MTTDTLASVHAGREVIYNLFYRAFIDSPREDLYTMLEELLPNMAELSGEELKQGVDKLNGFIRERAALEGEALAEYDLDTLRFYTRIMCLTDSAPNTESYYTSPEKLSMQEARDEVLKYYADNKFTKDSKYNEHEDFISNEMRFMSYLAKLTAEAYQNNNEEKMEELTRTQHRFLTEHPLRWIPEFAGRVAMYKESARLYAPMALVMSEFIKSDAEFLGELLSGD